MTVLLERQNKIPWSDSWPKPVWLDDLLDDERVEDDNGEVGQQVGQDQLAPDDIDGGVELLLTKKNF